MDSDFITAVKLVLDYAWNERDKKADGWFLCDSSLPMVFFTSFYIFFAIYLGPNVMSNFKPFTLKKTFFIFNLAIFLMNVVLHYQFWASGWATTYKWICQEQDFSINEQSLKMARTCWWFYMNKYLDCFYTVFCILKKKFYKISFQHVAHHSTMVVNGFLLARFFPGGHITFAGLANTLSHSVAYLYFGLANLNPNSSYRKPFALLNFLEFAFTYHYPYWSTSANIPASSSFTPFSEGGQKLNELDDNLKVKRTVEAKATSSLKNFEKRLLAKTIACISSINIFNMKIQNRILIVLYNVVVDNEITAKKLLQEHYPAVRVSNYSKWFRVVPSRRNETVKIANRRETTRICGN
uniref:Elongation of very long chain fatty acids protein n=1 Tax=Strigamia maritima TaxID=126957 RepID=T1IMP9_STRMM